MPSLQAVAEVPTASASRYLQQLCKHFQHKLPTTFDEHAGGIEFPLGMTTLSANAETLTLRVEAETVENLAQLEGVVERHLVRFAFRETLDVRWKPAS